MNYSFLLCLTLLYSSSTFAEEGIEVDKYVPPYSLLLDSLSPDLGDKSEVQFVIKGLENQKFIRLNYSFNEKEFAIELHKAFEFSERIDPGTFKCMFFFNEDYFEIITDSIVFEPGHLYVYQLTFERADMMYIVDKPVIYVYPDSLTEIEVQIVAKDEITFTYPPYNQGWRMTASPNGNIRINDDDYNYLFWEGTHVTSITQDYFETGFVVAGANITEFLLDKLTLLGFNSKEKADFITFWAPRMIQNDFNFLRFMINEECNQVAELLINPSPDKVNRVYMSWCAVPQEYKPNEQKLTSFNREGFDILEWGGERITPPTSLNFNLIN